MPVDPRLLDIVAACLCWAEWSNHAERTDDPLSYWRTVHPEIKPRYMSDAEIIADMMSSNQHYLPAPVEPMAEMIDAAKNAGRGIRSNTGAREVWKEMLTAAKQELGWRSGKTQENDNA